MPTIAYSLLIAYLFWNDARDPRPRSSALWIPFAWMFLAGSRYASSWLNIGPDFSSVSDYSEGSPVDAAVFLSLIIAAIAVLSQRNIDWIQLLRNNIWIVLYFIFCLTSMAWSDEPLILAKRWIKDLGNPIMALVMLTDPRPYEAVALVLRRLSFLLLPLSVLFIRYYPQLGRAYHSSGDVMYVGVGHQKNDLGLICLICGIYIAWEFLRRRTPNVAPLRLSDKIMLGGLFALLLWLLRQSDSQTASVCLMAGIAILASARLSVMQAHPGMMVLAPFGASLTLWTLDELFDLKDQLLLALGRNSTLTNRTEIWDIVLRHVVDPLKGAGFMSFWAGERADRIAAELGAPINQAHNGYLEQYLNLGYIGVAFIIAILVAAIVRIGGAMARDPSAATLRLAFVVVAILYNFTEASFYGMSNMWLLLLLGCLEVPYQRQAQAVHVSTPAKAYVARRFRSAGGTVLPVPARRRRALVSRDH